MMLTTLQKREVNSANMRLCEHQRKLSFQPPFQRHRGLPDDGDGPSLLFLETHVQGITKEDGNLVPVRRHSVTMLQGGTKERSK